MAAQSAMALNMEASLSSLSSDMLILISQYLHIEELGPFDTAINNKQLRAKFLIGVSNDTYHFPGISCYRYDGIFSGSASWQQNFAEWLVLRRLFVKSIRFDGETTASVRLIYDTFTGLESLTIVGKADFPVDLAVRNAQTLRSLVLKEQGKEGEMRGLFGSMRRLQTEGISLTKLTFNDCHFGDEVVDVGNDALSELTIDQCCSGRYHTPGISTFGCTHLVWDIVQKCPNLERFTCIDQQTFATMETGEGEYDEVAEDAILTGSEVTMSDADLCALAKFCPDLETLYINSYDTRITEKSIIYLAMRGTQLRELGLYLKRDKALTDAAIIAIANMAHLKVLEVGTLELKNPLTLRCIAHQCPHLKSLSLHTSNVTEAELVYFAQHGQLDRLAVGKQQLNFPGKSIRTDHHSYRPGYLPVLDAGDIEALEAAQRTWLLTAEQHWLHLPAGENTEEKLKAADPHLTVLWMSASRSEYHLSVDLGDARVPRLFTNISSEWSDYTAHLVSFP